MNLQVKLAFEGNLAGFGDNVRKSVARAIGAATARIATEAKLKLREDTRAGGLGERVANAWQQKEFSNPGRDPAALVWSKAPLIVQAFAEDTTIAPIEGRFLAIPTDNVPEVSRASGHGKATVRDVELLYGKPIIKKGRNGNLLVFVDATKSKSGKGYKPSTKGRLKQGRKAELILMFILVPQVHLQKRLNWPDIFKDMKGQWQDILGEEVERALARV